MMVDCIDSLGITPLMRFATFGPMSAAIFNLSCANNCSGHGDCYEGICFCDVQFSGGNCTAPNVTYFASFSTIYYLICGITFIQLMLCIKAEYERTKPPSLLRACQVTTQKALYLLICLATAIRGFYFSSPDNATLQWTSSLLSAYYPVLLTGSSLIVCFWAEVFHLNDLKLDTPHFLSKSFLGFVAFNIITYSLLLAELVLLQFTNPADLDRKFLMSIFNSSYAVLMLVVVIFFLIYGVQVFFKVQGGFIQGPSNSRDTSQLHQSRLGLVSQAILLLVTICFMVSDVLQEWWIDKVPVLSRNCHNVIFRVVEMGVALWFPCVLWNCLQPDQLWILNPRRLLKKLESDAGQVPREAEALVSAALADLRSDLNISLSKLPECWICYDADRIDAGPLIQPCVCKGDVSVVHHECLKKWLIESSDNEDNMKCKVCNSRYELERGLVWLPQGLTSVHWLQTAVVTIIMCSSIAGACLLVKVFDNVGIRTMSVGVALLVVYICLRLLGFNFLSAYHRAKFSAVKIIGKKLGNVAGGKEPISHIVVSPHKQAFTDCADAEYSTEHTGMLTKPQIIAAMTSKSATSTTT